VTFNEGRVPASPVDGVETVVVRELAAIVAASPYAAQEPTDAQEERLMLRGVFLVKMRVHTNRIDFDLPTGTISLGPEERNGWLVGHWH